PNIPAWAMLLRQPADQGFAGFGRKPQPETPALGLPPSTRGDRNSPPNATCAGLHPTPCRDCSPTASGRATMPRWRGLLPVADRGLAAPATTSEIPDTRGDC